MSSSRVSLIISGTLALQVLYSYVASHHTHFNQLELLHQFTELFIGQNQCHIQNREVISTSANTQKIRFLLKSSIQLHIFSKDCPRSSICQFAGAHTYSLVLKFTESGQSDQ
jgi:hypothetical protein